MSSVRICVVGLGYVGLPTALKFAQAGHAVSGYDCFGSSFVTSV